MLDLTVIILTFNEEKHIRRCIESVKKVSSKIYVVDSGSTDSTVAIARDSGAKVLTNAWSSHAKQFNWALKNIEDSEWVLRVDADEVLDNLAISSINSLEDKGINGYELNRSIFFMGQKISWGGVFPISVVRLFRKSKGVAEEKLMDEHIKISGKIAKLNGNIYDISLNSLSWWIEKHNNYASLEAAEVISQELSNSEKFQGLNKSVLIKRFIKNNVYYQLPLFIRPVFYFLYRYILRLGFLDGILGLKFHFFHAFFYRFLVDAKLYEIKRYAKINRVDVKKALSELTNNKINID